MDVADENKSAGVSALFKRTDNEELNTILHEIQDKIILPAYLPPKQRKIIFSEKKKAYLEQNPIEIEVEGFEHRFKHINRKSDIPPTNEITDKAMRAMKTREDWDNLGTLLAGLKNANQMTDPARMGKILRYVTAAGQTGAAIGCLKQFRETGLVVASKEVLLRLYTSICKDVNEAEGNLEVLQKIQRWSDIVQDVIRRPEHEEKIRKLHVGVDNYAEKQMQSASEDLKVDLRKIFGATSNADLANSVFARTMALHPRIAVVKAKQAAGVDAETDIVKLNDEIEAVTSLWYDYQKRDTTEFDMARVTETYQVCPSTNPHGNLWKWFKNRTLSDTWYLVVLGRTHVALKEAEEMAPSQAQRLSEVRKSIIPHACLILQVIGKKTKGYHHKLAVFKDTTGVDLEPTLASMPPLENHRTQLGIDPALLGKSAEAELEEGAAAEEELEAAESGSEAKA